MKPLLLLIIPCFIFSANVKAQIDHTINGDASDFKMLQKRKMIVVLMDEDQKLEEKLTKKGKTDELNTYKNFISTFNQDLKAAVTKYWTFNKDVEFKNESEMDKITGSSKEYVILSYRALADVNPDFQHRTKSTLPILQYTRSERNERKNPDNYVFLPPISLPQRVDAVPEEWTYAQSSFIFAIRELQASMLYMIKVNKSYEFQEYAKKVSEDGKCTELQQSTLLMQKSRLDSKSKIADFKTLYTGAFDFVDDNTFDNAMVNEEAGKSVMFMVPFYLFKSGGSTFATLCFMKVVIDCKTGDILYEFAPGIGQATDDIYRDQIFKNLGKCKS